MGSWFSNFHIHKNDQCKEATVADALVQLMTEKGYQCTENSEAADARIIFLIEENSDWISLWSDYLTHDDPESCGAIASPLSAILHTDVMGIACFDSDYLYLNLIHADEKVDGWIGIGAGKEIGISRRNKLSPWKNIVADYAGFSALTKQKYVIADSFLQDVSGKLGIDYAQSSFSGEYTGHGKIISLHFTRKTVTGNSGNVHFAHYPLYFPCVAGQETIISAVNQGSAGTGLSIYFLGAYVEQEDITFSDVEIYCENYSAAIRLNREQLKDGQWAYAYHDPEFAIPAGAPRRLRKEKRAALEYERRISLRFIPHGNPRKMLDITAAFIPLENPRGGTQCNVWSKYGSKQAFIEHYNKINKRVRAFEPDPDQWMPYLKEEDFDL